MHPAFHLLTYVMRKFLDASCNSAAVDCIALNYLSKHKQEMAIRGIN